MSQRIMTSAEFDILKNILPIINCLESVTKAQKVRKEDDILKEEFDMYLKMKNNLKEDEDENKILKLNSHMKNNFKILELYDKDYEIYDDQYCCRDQKI